MKKSSIVAFVLIFTMVLCLIPVMEAPAAAATSHYISFTNLSSQNPIMDMHLSFDTFKSGGPFTVTMETKVENVEGWTNPMTGVKETNPAIVTYVEGTVYGSPTTKQRPDGTNDASTGFINLKGDGWQSSTFKFQNVGTINVSGNDIPGNLLRTYFWQTTGTVYIRNVKIKNAAGTVVYDMNNDADLLGLVSQMQASGMTESDISNVASINENCLWCAPGSFGVAGDHYGTLHIDNGSSTSKTSTSTRIPVTGTTTTTSTVTKTTGTTVRTTAKTTAPTASKVTTSATSATPPVTYPDYVCMNGDHVYAEGACIYCGGADPNHVEPTAPTTAPTTQPATQQTANNDTADFNGNILVIVILVVFLVFAGAIVILYGTKKKG